MDEENLRLYDYLIKNFPVTCNSHNARVNVPNTELKATVQDIAIFVLERFVKAGVKIE